MKKWGLNIKKWVDDLMKIQYDSVMDDYISKKDEFEWLMRDWTPIKLKDMQESHMQNCIKMLEKKHRVPSEMSGRDKAWIHVFEEQLMIRRRIKLEKIMNTIKDGQNKIL